jgi:hypothetical protein
MFADFLNKLSPINRLENNEWQDVLTEYKKEFASIEPTLFWYISSGVDLRALVHFNEKDTHEIYNTPTVDFFIYSDYGGIKKELNRYYDNLDDGAVILYKDYGPTRNFADYLHHKLKEESGNEGYRTLITLQQMIPLRYFSASEVNNLNKKFNKNRHHSLCNQVVPDSIHFYYCLIEIDSNYFGNEYFPLLISPIENWVLMESVWKKECVLFDYICAGGDGCRKGGAYKCANKHYNDFLPILKEKKYWVSDHLHYTIQPEQLESSFRKIAELRGWGNYNTERRSGNEIQISYLYEMLENA